MALGSMANFIFRDTLILVCIILAIVLIITPVMIHMYIKMRKTEIRIEKKEKLIDQKIQNFERTKGE